VPWLSCGSASTQPDQPSPSQVKPGTNGTAVVWLNPAQLVAPASSSRAMATLGGCSQMVEVQVHVQCSTLNNLKQTCCLQMAFLFKAPATVAMLSKPINVLTTSQYSLHTLRAPNRPSLPLTPLGLHQKHSLKPRFK